MTMRTIDTTHGTPQYLGYPDLLWAEQHQAHMRRMAAEARQAHEVQRLQPRLRTHVARLMHAVREWVLVLSTRPKTANGLK